MFHLRKISKGEGDFGRCSEARMIIDGKSTIVDFMPKVGAIMVVGSYTARSYSCSDYWVTTQVTEIIEEHVFGEKEDGILFSRFKTKNSEYIWFSILYYEKFPEKIKPYYKF